MYVCICNAIKELELRDMARKCSGSAEQLYTKLGKPPQCRQCIDEAEEILLDARSAMNVPACVAH